VQYGNGFRVVSTSGAQETGDLLPIHVFLNRLGADGRQAAPDEQALTVEEEGGRRT
jgi:hypothetical protein